MKMDKESEYKMMLHRIVNTLSRETTLTVSYELIDDNTVDFMFHGTNFGNLTINAHDKLIQKLGEDVFKQHLRELRRGALDAETRTTKRILQQDWGVK